MNRKSVRGIRGLEIASGGGRNLRRGARSHSRLIACIDFLEPRRLLSTTFTVNPALSNLTISGTVAGIAITPQPDFSLTDGYSGTISATISSNSFALDGASIVANSAGTAQPGSAAANYAYETKEVDELISVDALRGVTSSITSGSIPISTGGSFDATGFLVSDTAGEVDYGSRIGSGSFLQTNETGTNVPSSTGTLVTSNGQLTLTIPIETTYTETVLSHLYIFNLVGQVVATAQTHLAFGHDPGNINAGGTLGTVTVEVEDSNGDLIPTDNSRVKLFTHSVSGLLFGTTKVNTINGVATFTNVSMDDAGTCQLVATDGGLSAQSSPFTVSPGVGTQLAVSREPGSAVAGAAISPPIVVDVEDQFGNIATGDSSSVTLTVFSGAGTISGTDSVSTISGKARFNDVFFDTAGSYKLTASDGTFGPVHTTRFQVFPASPDLLIFNPAPGDTMVNQDIAPIDVDIEDVYGNIETLDNTKVSLAITKGPPGAALTGITTVHAHGGIATFSGLTLNAPGAYKLFATNGSLFAKTPLFQIAPGPADKVAFLQGPTGTAPNDAISPAITLEVEDVYGNVETSDNSSTVTLALKPGGTGSGTLSGTLTAVVSNGIATFSDVFLTDDGTYRLVATDGTLGLAASSKFEIAPAVANSDDGIGYIDGAPTVNDSGTAGDGTSTAGDGTSGTVEFYDFQVALSNLLKANQSWDQGDFDYGSTVNFDDFQAVLANFGLANSALTSAELGL